METCSKQTLGHEHAEHLAEMATTRRKKKKASHICVGTFLGCVCVCFREILTPKEKTVVVVVVVLRVVVDVVVCGGRRC